MLKRSRWFVYSLSLVLVNVVIGHFLPPSSIMLSPIVISLMTIFTLELKVRVLVKSFLIGILISLQDVGVKLFAVGTHDYVGLVWIHFMLLMGLIPSFLIIVYFYVKDQNENVFQKMIGILVFILMVVIHISLFSKLGVN